MQETEASSSLLPDLLVYCRQPPPDATDLTDATMIVEVMSQGTQRRDREDKCAVYQTLPHLKHYTLVTRDRPHIETIDRVGNEWSAFRIADGLAANLVLSAFDIDIPLAEIYADLFEA